MPDLLRPALLCVLLAGPCAFAAAAQDAPSAHATAPVPAGLAGFDAYVAGVQETFDVPGIAVAIIDAEGTVLERGWGVRELGKPAPVDAHTLFAIASNTKAFTSASLSILADEGRLSLDDRVIDHLPWFRMADAYVTREMRLRDLLVHHSGLGLGAGDLLYWPTTSYSNREVVERLAHVPLAGGFRAGYAYDNILYGVAQQVIETVGGQSYAEFLRTRIFEPLGMDETRFNADHLRPGDAAATGHARADFTDLAPVAPMTWSNVAGAGGIYSSVHDLATWMRVQLDGGVIEGEGDGARRLFSQARHEAMWTVVTPRAIRPPQVPALAAATPNFLGYGEGWNISDYRGEKLVWHTGGWPGMVSRVTLVPSRKIGIVVLTNAEAGAAFQAVTMRALDAMLGAPDTDWTAAYAAGLGRQQEEATADWERHLAARDADSEPSLPLADYAGTYRDPWYGDVRVERSGTGLAIRFSKTAQLVGDLEHWQHDTFLVRWRDRQLNADAFLSFALTPDGAIREARMEPVSPLTDFSFDFQDLRLAPVGSGDADADAG
ncbi:serine hydrolase [Coralloluteibacterium stylophorae]|uniref:Serine hydrolase n=1 Tax=Coralloluteibacterium stylophorae TaxID=1776034 RepID=A0A8J7VTR2_9GAMM|nr:serine hydrolase [Coralloluteibacterium stylophorae]MBS7455602.1 serine hydrolase [Coralloluteibacterium stylophorae]